MIPFIDLKSQYERVQTQVTKRIHDVLESGHYIMGPEVKEMEDLLAKYVGVNHCIAVSSGTDALLIPLMAWGVSPGDEVIIPNFSFFATAEVVELLGAKCVFVDIDPVTYNLDAKMLEAKISSKTKAIIAVSLYGRCADFDSINKIASRHGIPVIEDGAQSFGATLGGKKSCGLSTVGATSFFPSKPLGCYGDGGACFTNDNKLAMEMREIRIHGQSKRYQHTRIGINGRMDTIQAAILIEKMSIFDDELKARREIAERYNQGIKSFTTPKLDFDTHAMAQYTIESDSRDELIAYLNKHDIPTAIHYPGTLSEQLAISDRYKELNTPHAHKASRKVLSLPMSPYLKLTDQQKIIDVLNAYGEK